MPSIVFGLLGLAVFLNFFGLPRSAPLVGGLTLALMTLPTIIIAGRVGDRRRCRRRSARPRAGSAPRRSRWCAHHVLPLAMPGILTGTIIGMARALGETAPLLMIGMVAFIVDVPARLHATRRPRCRCRSSCGPTARSAASSRRPRARSWCCSAFLIVMNGAAIWLRQRFEKRW